MSIATFFIMTAGEGYACKLHSHPHWEIVYCEGSGGEIEVGGTTRKYKAGDVLVLPPDIVHKQTCPEGGFHWCLGVSGGEVSGLKEAYFKDNTEIKMLFKRMAQELKEKRQLYKAFLESDAGKIVLISRRYGMGPSQIAGPEDERLKIYG